MLALPPPWVAVGFTKGITLLWHPKMGFLQMHTLALDTWFECRAMVGRPLIDLWKVLCIPSSSDMPLLFFKTDEVLGRQYGIHELDVTHAATEFHVGKKFNEVREPFFELFLCFTTHTPLPRKEFHGLRTSAR